MNSKSEKKSVKSRFKPSMREKKRYLVLRADLSSVKEMLKAIDRREWKVIECKESKTLLRLSLKHLNKMKEALALRGIPCIGISGTIKRAKEKFWK